MKEILELIKQNAKVQAVVQRGLVSDLAPVTHPRFGILQKDFDRDLEEEKRERERAAEELPLTLPIIKLCLADDVQQTGELREDHVVSIM